MNIPDVYNLYYPQYLIQDSDEVLTAAANLHKLDLNLSQYDCKSLARFIENKEYKKHPETYLQPHKTGLFHIIERDPVTNNIYIHYLGKIGKGGFKEVTKSILYDRDTPRIVANGEADFDDNAKNEASWNKKTEKMKGVLPVISIMTHKSPFLNKKKISFITEYFQPGSLQDLHNKGIKLTLLEKMKIARDIIRGVKNLHSKNIIHADLKPANIFINITEDGKGSRNVSAVVADLGMAYFRNVHKKVKYTHGTPCYTPPEGISEKKAHGSKAKYFDTYALGCTLYELSHEGKMPKWISDTALLDGKKAKKVKTVKDLTKVKKNVEKKIEEATKKVTDSTKKKKNLTPAQKFEKLICKMVNTESKKRGKVSDIYEKMKKIYHKERSLSVK